MLFSIFAAHATGFTTSRREHVEEEKTSARKQIDAHHQTHYRWQTIAQKACMHSSTVLHSTVKFDNDVMIIDRSKVYDMCRLENVKRIYLTEIDYKPLVLIISPPRFGL